MIEQRNGSVIKTSGDKIRKESISQNSEELQDLSKKSPRYVVMCIVIIFYRGSVQMFSQSLNQYIYYRLNADVNNASLNNNHTNSTVCGINVVHRDNEHDVERQAADWNTYFALVAYGLALISVILQGGLSDTFGRKILMILSPLTALIKYLIGSAVIYFRLNLYYLLIASAFEGIGGTIYAFNLGCYAIASDVTKKDKTRSIGIGLFDVVFGFALSSAQIGGGYLIQEVNFIIPCLISVGFVLISLTVCICFVPETLKNKQNVPLKQICYVIGRNFKAFASNMRGRANNHFLLSFIAFALMQFPRSCGVGLETLYVLQDPFCWDPILIGWYGAAKTFLSPFISVGVLKSLHLCFPDQLISLIGCLSTIAYYALLGIAKTDWMIYGGRL